MKEQCILMTTGQTAFFRGDDQVPELQVSWLKMYVQFLEDHGVDPTKVDFTLPGGYTARPFKTDEGHWSWDLRKQGMNFGAVDG